MSHSAAGYVAEFEQANEELIALIEGCSDEQLRLVTLAEGWEIAVVGHHVAVTYPAFAGIVEAYSRGETFSPSTSMDVVDEMNAAHAREYAGVAREVVIEKLQTGGELIASGLRTVSDDQLANPAGTYGPNEFTVEQALDYIIVGHTKHHIANIRETLDATS